MHTNLQLWLLKPLHFGEQRKLFLCKFFNTGVLKARGRA